MIRIVFVLTFTCKILFANVLQDVINKAKPYSILNLPEGIYKGNIIITKPITILGKNQKSIIQGDGNATVIKIRSSDVVLSGLHVKGSGSMHQRLDAGISVKEAKYVEIKNCLVDDVLFGIDFDQTHNSKLIGNTIYSKDGLTLGLRGDGVRLWYSNNNLIQSNKLIKSRDMVVWYSHGNIIEKNYGQECRYSLHFMYTGANIVRDNEYVKNSVGIFFMYSRDTIATGNIIKSSLGATGMGIGLKEVSGFTIKNNTILYCAQGLYIDWSPFEPDMQNFIENNHILYNSEGIRFHSKSVNNVFKMNSFVGNLDNVVNDTSHSDINENLWYGNYWDDYEGFDLDKDGVGDTPYKNFYYADKMWLYHPSVKFFYGSAVISIINFLAKLAPFSEPVNMFEDKAPSKKMIGAF